MSNQVARQERGVETDAKLLIKALTKDPTCVCSWEMDCVNQLSMVMWSTAEQHRLARQFGGVVLQDNTGLTTR